MSAVGALAGVALFGPRAALPLAVTMAVVAWSASRPAVHYVLFNIGALCLASLTAAGVFAIGDGWSNGKLAALFTAFAGLVAGGTYFIVNTGLTSGAMAIEGHERWRAVWNERFSWLLPHYVAFGAVAGAIALAYEAIGLYSLAVFVLPLLLMRKTMAAYLTHTQKKHLQAPRGSGDDQNPERVARAGEPSPARTLDCSHGESLCHRRRPRRVYRRPLASRPAARPLDWAGAPALAARARPPRPRRALP